MGERWVYEKQERNDNGYGDIYIDDSRAHRHDDYVRIHNADCDAYEARIAELEEERDAAVEFAHATERAFCTANTELARVKAESLRVVEDGKPMEIEDLDPSVNWYVMRDGKVYYDEDGSSSFASLTNTKPVFPQFDDDTIVQPVRFERWEDEE